MHGSSRRPRPSSASSSRRRIDEGPQTVTRHGKDAVVVLSAEQFELMKKRQIDLKELLQSAPWKVSWRSSATRVFGARDRLVRYLLDTNVISEVRQRQAVRPQRCDVV